MASNDITLHGAIASRAVAEFNKRYAASERCIDWPTPFGAVRLTRATLAFVGIDEGWPSERSAATYKAELHADIALEHDSADFGVIDLSEVAFTIEGLLDVFFKEGANDLLFAVDSIQAEHTAEDESGEVLTVTPPLWSNPVVSVERDGVEVTFDSE